MVDELGATAHKKRDAPLSESPANALQKVGGFSDLSIPPHAAYALLHHLIAKKNIRPPRPIRTAGGRAIGSVASRYRWIIACRRPK